MDSLKIYRKNSQTFPRWIFKRFGMAKVERSTILTTVVHGVKSRLSCWHLRYMGNIINFALDEFSQNWTGLKSKDQTTSPILYKLENSCFSSDIIDDISTYLTPFLYSLKSRVSGGHLNDTWEKFSNVPSLKIHKIRHCCILRIKELTQY